MSAPNSAGRKGRGFLRRALVSWGGGFVGSLVSIWAITAIFTENEIPRSWSPEVKRNVPLEGWTFRGARENLASTRYGPYGLVGVDSPGIPSGPKVLIWGDSFVEAFHVDDPDKMHRQLTRKLSHSSDLGQVTALAMGQSWWSVADYVFRIPDYEQALGEVRLHVIHLFTLEDTYPDQYPGARMSLFLGEPELRFEKFDNEYHQLEAPRNVSPLKAAVFAARPQFFFSLKKKLGRLVALDDLRFTLGEQQSVAGSEPEDAHRRWDRLLTPEWAENPPPVEAWSYALEALASSASAPVLVVYAPAAPTLAGGEPVVENPEAELVDRFSEVCGAHEIPLLNLEKDFLDLWETKGRFPRGFASSRPWEGHYNRDGHRIVAEAIADWLEENPHVVHPD